VRHRGQTIAPADGASKLSFSTFIEIGHHFSLFPAIGHHDSFQLFLRWDLTIPFLVMIRLHLRRFSDRTSPLSDRESSDIRHSCPRDDMIFGGKRPISKK